MMQSSWRRFLPDRSRFMILMVVVIVLVAGMSFVNLGFAKNAARTANRSVHAQYDEALQQRDLLQRALAGAQRGENIVPKAYDYFFLTPAGVTTVLVEPAAEETSRSESVDRRSSAPFWLDWWQHLAQP